MMSFISSIVIASQLTGTAPADVIAQSQYVIPTVTQATVNDAQNLSPVFSWRVEKRKIAQGSHPRYVGEMNLQPTVTARSAIIIDVDTKDILWQKNPESRIPPASITKLMTALVWKDLFTLPQETLVTIEKKDQKTEVGSKDLLLPLGSMITAQDLFTTMLVGSYNDVTKTLVRSTGLSEDAFVDAMNQKARAIGLQHTVFADPTGLDSATISSAYDVALLAAIAQTHPDIAPILTSTQASISVKNPEMLLTIVTTDLLLEDPKYTILGGKTGYTQEAGYCFVAIIQNPETDRRIAIAVLGASDSESRFTDTVTLAQWAWDNYRW